MNLHSVITNTIPTVRTDLIQCDNMSAILLIKNPVFHACTKHKVLKPNRVLCSVEKNNQAYFIDLDDIVKLKWKLENIVVALLS